MGDVVGGKFPLFLLSETVNLYKIKAEDGSPFKS